MELMMPLDEYKRYRMNKGELSKNRKLDRFLSWETSAGRNMFSIQAIDDRLRVAAKFLARKPNLVVVCGELESEGAAKFGEALGVNVIDGYRCSLFSNPKNKDFTEPDAVFVTNADENRNVIGEANINKIPVVAFCNTNSSTDGIDLIIPLNVTSMRAIEVALWLVANQIRKSKGEAEIALEEFGTGQEE
ncbi:MAG: 30S ribosomal protein S2 [Candidatus Aenigmatarchaeota archaeon]